METKPLFMPVCMSIDALVQSGSGLDKRVSNGFSDASTLFN